MISSAIAKIAFTVSPAINAPKIPSGSIASGVGGMFIVLVSTDVPMSFSRLCTKCSFVVARCPKVSGHSQPRIATEPIINTAQAKNSPATSAYFFTVMCFNDNNARNGIGMPSINRLSKSVYSGTGIYKTAMYTKRNASATGGALLLVAAITAQ